MSDNTKNFRKEFLNGTAKENLMSLMDLDSGPHGRGLLSQNEIVEGMRNKGFKKFGFDDAKEVLKDLKDCYPEAVKGQLLGIRELAKEAAEDKDKGGFEGLKSIQLADASEVNIPTVNSADKPTNIELG